MNSSIVDNEDFQYINFKKTFLYFLNKPNDSECSDWLAYVTYNIEEYDYEYILSKTSDLIKLGGDWLKLYRKCQAQTVVDNQYELEQKWVESNKIDITLFTNISNYFTIEHDYEGNISWMNVWPDFNGQYVDFKIRVKSCPCGFSYDRYVGKVTTNMIQAFLDNSFSQEELCEILADSCEQMYGDNLMSDAVRKENAIAQRKLVYMLETMNNG